MSKLGIGIVGGGYMGKAHAVAMSSVGAVFETKLRPSLEMVCATTPESAQRYQENFGYKACTDNWEELVRSEQVDAIVIASPQTTHRAIAELAFSLGKPVLCEKPLGASLEDATAMANAAKASGVINMVGFNYIRTPATQYARQLVESGAIGDVTWFRGEHTEDFYADPEAPASWRTEGRANGTMGDLAPHMIQCALSFMGPVQTLSAQIDTVHKTRPGPDGPTSVTNDDQAQLMCRFESGAMGHLYFSRTATGRKMGYAYEIFGTKGGIRFDQEDQNALWFYEMGKDAAQAGYKKILAGPAHPDYLPFCQGPGHGTGYQDQIIMEAAAFLKAIETGEPAWPTFEMGLEVSRVVDAVWRSHDSGAWTEVK